MLLPSGVQGWLTEAQAGRLAAAAAAAPEGAQIVEIGSFHGRSTIVLARAAKPHSRVVAIDPHLGSDRGPQEYAEDHDLGEGDTQTFQANLASHGVAGCVTHVRERSEAALPEAPDSIDVLYVDGAHRYRPALSDIRDWGDRVRPGGLMLVHDSFSSAGVTLALLRAVTFSNRWRYHGRDGSLAEYERADGRSAGGIARQLLSLPWFARNLLIKALILARLTPLTRLLGHDGGHWPY